MTVHHTTVMRWVHHYGLSLRCYGVDIKQFTLKVGNLTYLYRAIDSNGFTLDFELQKYHDYTAAYYFLKRLLTTRLVTNQYRATLKADKQLVKQNHFSSSAHQCFKYRNNLIEQDHKSEAKRS